MSKTSLLPASFSKRAANTTSLGSQKSGTKTVNSSHALWADSDQRWSRLGEFAWASGILLHFERLKQFFSYATLSNRARVCLENPLAVFAMHM